MSSNDEVAAPVLRARSAALDGLRGIAILMVLAHDFILFDNPAEQFGRAVAYLAGLGWAGVTLFFVLSGFLITRILLETQQSPTYFRAFYARRALRILPLYYGLLLTCFFILPRLGWVSEALDHDRARQAWYWLFLSNWVTSSGSQSLALPHLWSLAVEEQFYLIWPLLIHRLNPERVLQLCIAIALASLLARAGMLWCGYGPEVVYVSSICRMDALALGAAAAASFCIPTWRGRIRRIENRLPMAATLLFVAGFAATHNYSRTLPAGQVLGYSLLALVFTLLVVAAAGNGRAVSSRALRPLQFKPLGTFGRYSYAIYLFHKPLHEMVGKPLLDRLNLDPARDLPVSMGYALLATFATLAMAWVSYQMIEKHLLALRPSGS